MSRRGIALVSWQCCSYDRDSLQHWIPSSRKGIMASILLLLVLMTFITGVAFVFGLAVSYWIICGVLNFFNPSRIPRKPTRRVALAPTHSGD